MAQVPYNAPPILSSVHIATATTTVVKAAPGGFFGFMVNGTPAASETVTVYDNAAASGTLLAVFSLATTTVAPGFIPFGPHGIGVQFKTGLTVVTSGTTDLAVVYR